MIDILEKTKICTKCNMEYSATLEYFSPDKRNEDKLQSWCRRCIRKCQKHYYRTEKGKKWCRQWEQNHQEQRLAQRKHRYQKYYRETSLKHSKKYHNTIKGHLQICFSGMNRRCNNSKCKTYKYYGGRNIKCLFKSSDDFIDYVVNTLKVDPRGLSIDRIDNDGNYEPGNIRFITQAENNRNKF